MTQTPLRLLVVDDDRISRYLWRSIAEEMGLEVLEAGDPEQAQRFMEQIPPHLVVLDVLFPGGTGLDFLHALRHDERWREIPVIVCSGMAQWETVVQFAREGICTYLLKPFQLEEARARLWEILSRRGLVPPEAASGQAAGEAADPITPPEKP